MLKSFNKGQIPCPKAPKTSEQHYYSMSKKCKRMGQNVNYKPFQSSHSEQTIACSIHQFLHFSSTRNLDNKKQSQTSKYKFVKKKSFKQLSNFIQRGINMPLSINCWDMKHACKDFKGIPQILMTYTKIIKQLIICYNSIQSWAAVASFLVFNLYAGTLWLDEKVMKV